MTYIAIAKYSHCVRPRIIYEQRMPNCQLSQMDILGISYNCIYDAIHRDVSKPDPLASRGVLKRDFQIFKQTAGYTLVTEDHVLLLLSPMPKHNPYDFLARFLPEDIEMTDV